MCEGVREWGSGGKGMWGIPAELQDISKEDYLEYFPVSEGVSEGVREWGRGGREWGREGGKEGGEWVSEWVNVWVSECVSKWMCE
jgi:hypothetical protein